MEDESVRRWVAFLRAINVGGRRVAMARLRELFEELGFQQVDTYIASGNVIFAATGSGAEFEARISQHLQEQLGYEVPAYVREIEELANVTASSPFSSEARQPANKHYVTFLTESLTEEQRAALEELSNEVDLFATKGREIYWLRRMNAGKSMATSLLEKRLGLETTRRTFDTVQRIYDKYG